MTKAERILDWALSAIGTAWIQFLMIVLVIGFARMVRGMNPIVLRPAPYPIPRDPLGTPTPTLSPQPVILRLCNQPKGDGYLRKMVSPATKPASLWGDLEAEFYIVSGYAIGDDYTPGWNTSNGWQRGLKREVRPGITVACPIELMLGTALYIEGFGVRICEDRGGAIVGKRLDIAFPSPEAAMMFGKQRLAVVVIW